MSSRSTKRITTKAAAATAAITAVAAVVPSKNMLAEGCRNMVVFVEKRPKKCDATYIERVRDPISVMEPPAQ
jgi:hypothetical protein